MERLRVLVLGHNGMLGHMVTKYLAYKGIDVFSTNARYPSEEFQNIVKSFDGQFIINTIGAIPQKTKVFTINTELPIWLDTNCKSRVIHPGTDCEIDNDGYGISKKEARDYIVQNGFNTKIIKASIIGPELKDKKSLLEWFINTKEDVVNGWEFAMWNGITTLEWCKQCYNLITDWNSYNTETIIESECVSKYELLLFIKEIFSLNNKQVIKNSSVVINKCLSGTIKVKNIKEQLLELREFYYNENN